MKGTGGGFEGIGSAGGSAKGDAPGGEARMKVADGAVGGEKGDIDGHAHEEGVDEADAGEEEAFLGIEGGEAQEAAVLVAEGDGPVETGEEEAAVAPATERAGGAGKARGWRRGGHLLRR
jgi:hypothetical protein